MKKIVLSRLFLYKYRFYIGYSILLLIFAGLVFLMPLWSPGGVNREEMASAVAADELSLGSLNEGEIVDLPFRALQKLSIGVFGLSVYSVKLPAVVVGFATGVLLILLLNRWFKNNVAMMASGFVALSAFFLGLTMVGTANIMVVFWVVLVLWLGAKLVGSKKPDMAVLMAFFVGLALSCYSPLFIYLVVLIGLVALFQPHLRFFLKNYERVQMIVAFSVFGVLVAPLIFGVIVNGDSLRELLLGNGGDGYWLNMQQAFAPFFSFMASSTGGVLSPLFGMATAALVVVGMVASAGKMRTAKNAVTVALVVFAIAASGVKPVMATVMFVPILLLVASGIELTIGKWYELFPENPYARVVGVFPIGLFCAIAMVSGVMHFFYGYKYVPAVANEFEIDVSLVQEYLPTGGLLLVGGDELDYKFYRILENEGMVTVSQTLPDRADEVVATVAGWEGEVELPLHRIITSQKATGSDRLYLYRKEE